MLDQTEVVHMFRPAPLQLLCVISPAAGGNILPTRGAKHLSLGKRVGVGGVTKHLRSSMLIWLLSAIPAYQFHSEVLLARQRPSGIFSGTGSKLQQS